MYLAGDDYKQIRAAFGDAFDADSLRQMLREELAVRLEELVVPTQPLPVVIEQTLAWAQRTDRIAELVAGAKRHRPHNTLVQRLPDTFADTGLNQRGTAFIRGLHDDPAAVAWQQVFDKLLPLLLPHVRTNDDRLNLLTRAYRGSEAWVLDYIQIDGRPRDFAVHCLDTLYARGCHLLERLLVVLRPDSGVEQLAQLDVLASDITALCGERQSRPPLPATPPMAAPAAAASPPLYLAYAPADEPFARRLATVLARHGFRCHAERAGERGSPQWRDSGADGLTQAYAVLVVAGGDAWQDPYTVAELLLALDKRKQIVAVRRGNADLPAVLPSGQVVVAWDDHLPDPSLAALLAALPAPPPGPPAAGWPEMPADLVRYAAGLVHMSRLKLDELVRAVGLYYTPLHGHSRRQPPQLTRSRGDRLVLPWQAARPRYEHTPLPRRTSMEPLALQPESRRFTNAVDELLHIRRAVLLGEPGAGKTTTLYRLAAELIDAALLDRAAPVPLVVSLGLWTAADLPFEAFLRHQAGALADDWDAWLLPGRLALLLDGLNEIPSDQQAVKYEEVDAFLAQHTDLLAIVTCREQDYPPERALRLDRVTIEPLDPVQVRDFAVAYLDPLLGAGAGDELFWKLAGEAARDTYRRFTEAVGRQVDAPFQTFWSKTELPPGVTWGWDFWGAQDNRHWTDWTRARAEPADLLRLAFNPYLLTMLLTVYMEHDQSLPANRGQLFDRFVEQLLVRERLFTRDDAGAVVRLPAGEALLSALAALALDMQTVRAAGEVAGSSWTVIPHTRAARFLTTGQRRQAVSASLLTPGDEVRFTHQLLQEYSVAQAMRRRIFNAPPDAAPLQAAEIWPADRWWQPTNWEEAASLLAGLYSDDCTPVLEWLAGAQPELAARCIVESGAHTPEETKLHLRARWLRRLSNTGHDRAVQARAAVGRALGRVRLADGASLDNRPGVGWVLQRGVKLPDIAWGAVVPVGRYPVGGDARARNSFKKHTIPIAEAYQLARYPVTYAQFQCFVEAAGVADERWWAGMPAMDRYGPVRDFVEQAYKFDNHPRENVSWYQAIAFCRWLSDKLGYEVTLSTEYEWEVAARYPDGRVYPWGDEFDAAKANTAESGIGQTSAVGLFPDGANPALGLYDLSGNVWEWCRNKYGDPADDRVDDSVAWRALRGGSWNYSLDGARAAYRDWSYPDFRFTSYGFRVARRPPSQ